MNCAEPECRRRADLAVGMGEGLHVVLCWEDALQFLLLDPTADLTIKVVGVGRRVTVRTRGA